MTLKPQLAKTLYEAIRFAVDWDAIEKDMQTHGSTVTAVVNDGAATCCRHQSDNAVASTGTRELIDMMKEMMLTLKQERSPQWSDRGRDRRGRGRGRGFGRGNGNLRCWGCGAPGHQQRNCPQTIECWSCGQTGHYRADCPGGRGRSGNGQ